MDHHLRIRGDDPLILAIYYWVPTKALQTTMNDYGPQHFRTVVFLIVVVSSLC